MSTPEVAEIVNLAVHLRRPLLVEGEAGCGKTRLAHAIAQELGLVDSMVTATVKSTSQARDLLYRFDALRRLQDAQDKANVHARQVWPYITLQPLGRVLQAGRPAVVLIDEVDKADIDFPNDLLDVLDRFEFEIDDLPEEESAACQASAKGFGRVVRTPTGGTRPVVIITSNREKQLPEPFLRRCLYVKLQFPADEKMLEDIVRRNLAITGTRVASGLVRAAVGQFMNTRALAERRGLQKLPATSELVDWVRALHWQSRIPEGGTANTLRPTDYAILFKVQKDLERWKAGADAEATD